MKKLLLILTLAFFANLANAQELGLRFGDVTGGNVAVDAIFATSKLSRVHADVSFGDGGLGIDALFDFAYAPLADFPLNWYIGAGPSIFINDPLSVSAMTEFGLEYQFDDVPMSLSMDWRPILQLVETTDLHFGLFGVNVRYVFP